MSFLTQARPTLALALPIMAGQLSQMGIGLVDSAMVGHVSTLALAAAAFAVNVANIPTVFGISAMSGLSVRVAQAQGAGDDESTAELLRHGVWLSLVIGIAISLLMLATVPLLDHLGQDPRVVHAAKPFFILLCLSVAPVVVGWAAKSFGEAMRHPWPPTLLFLASIPLTAFLNWVFVYGNLGSPVMGLTGSGVATLLARLIATVALLAWLFKSARFSHVRPSHWRGRLNAQETRTLAAVGIPTAFQVAVEVGAFAIGALIVGMLGEVAFAAHQIAITCAGTVFMLPLGIAIATTVRIGNAVGARQLDTVRSIGVSSALMGTLFMILSGLLFWLLGHHIAAVFVKDPQVIDLAAQLLVVASIFQLCDGVQATMAGALRGLSDAVVPMVLCIVGYWVLAIPFGYFLAFKMGMGARGMWWGFALGLAIVAITLSYRFYLRTRHRDLEEIAEHLPSEVALAH
ncbi:multidrug resistance protein NorM [Abditibacteriota bacterium]|nr:multidrug resistance protein NorM [Abditibacteriota bacterium]